MGVPEVKARAAFGCRRPSPCPPGTVWQRERLGVCSNSKDTHAVASTDPVGSNVGVRGKLQEWAAPVIQHRVALSTVLQGGCAEW